MAEQSILLPRKIGELELDFENPTWNSNWDFEEAPPQARWVGRVGFWKSKGWEGWNSNWDFEEFKAGWAGAKKQQNFTNDQLYKNNNKILLIINY